MGVGDLPYQLAESYGLEDHNLANVALSIRDNGGNLPLVVGPVVGLLVLVVAYGCLRSSRDDLRCICAVLRRHGAMRKPSCVGGRCIFA